MRAFLLVLLVSVGTAALAGEPIPRGPIPFQVQGFTLRDPERGRSVEVLLVAPVAGDPVPLVVFSPGFLLAGGAYRGTGEILASHGIAVALLTYDVNLFTANHRILAADLRFVLRALPGAAWERGVRLDPDRVGLAGHSLGGKLSFLVAAEDPALRAVAGLDPVDGGAPGTDDPVRFPSAVAVMDRVKIPVLLLGAERGGVVRFGTPCAPPEGNYTKFFTAAPGPALEVTQLGAGHMDYLDDPNCGFACSLCAPGLRPAQARADAQAYLLLFFRAHLLGDAQAADALADRLAADEAAGSIVVRKKDPGRP